MKLLTAILLIVCINTSLTVQAQSFDFLKQINNELDNKAYWEIEIDYKEIKELPDSIKEKVLNALNLKLPEIVQNKYGGDILNSKVRDSTLCKNILVKESLTFERCLDSISRKRKILKFSENENQVSKTLILGLANGNVTEAIPILKRNIGNKKFPQLELSMALAKFGNDSCKAELLSGCTLEYVLRVANYSTMNQDKINSGEYEQSITHYIQRFYSIGSYLEEMAPILNIVDLYDITGMSPFLDFEYIHQEALFLSDLSYIFNDLKCREIWRKLITKYLREFAEAKKDDKKLKVFLSQREKDKVKTQLKEWIKENIIF